MAVRRTPLSMFVILVLAAACSSGESETAPSSTATSAAVSPIATDATVSPSTTVAAEPLEVGLDWVEVAYNEGAFTDAALSDVTAFGSGWIATGVTGEEGALAVWISEDGIEWSILEADAFGGSTDDLQTVGRLPKCSYSSTIRPAGNIPGPTVETDGNLLVLGCGAGIWTSTSSRTRDGSGSLDPRPGISRPLRTRCPSHHPRGWRSRIREADPFPR